MRIARLSLDRYGHLSDIELAFPPECGLHVLLGPNEAGKSTALAAIGDCLFGFPHRTPFAFVYREPELRIGIELSTADGRSAFFFRRKRRKNDLTDADGQPVPESAIASFLAGATRERFERIFGLDGAGLRAGGEAILKGEGEVGESILQAHTGLSGFRALDERLNEEAKSLFGDRHGRREFYVAIERYKEAKRELDQRSVAPEEYRQKSEEQKRLIEARQANAAEATRLSAERERLDRIRRTAPSLGARAEYLRTRKPLDPVPALPAEAEERRQAAVAARAQAEHDLRRERASEAELVAKLKTLLVNETLLAEAEAIDALAADRNRIASASEDREHQRIVAEENRRAVGDGARRLGLTAEVETIAVRIPDALTRGAAGRAIAAYERLAERREQAHAALALAKVQQETAEKDLAAMLEPAPSAPLREAIEEVKTEGRIDAELATSREAAEASDAELARRLASLPLWTGDAEALAAAPVPLKATIDEHAQALAKAEENLSARQAERATLGQSLAETAGQLTALAAAGELPTKAAIAAARARRDHAWKLIRRHRIDGGRAPTEEELAGFGAATDLPAALEALIAEADELGDRRAAEAERLGAYEQLRARETAERDRYARFCAAEAEAAKDHGNALSRWQTLWAPVGIAPQPPAAMAEWLRKRAEIVDKHGEQQEARKKLAAVATRHAAACSRLAARLPPESRVAGSSVANLLKAAQRLSAKREAEESAWTNAQAALQAALAAAEKAAQTTAKAETEIADWTREWVAIAARLGLSREASAEDGRIALELWREVEAKAEAWDKARQRIGEMTQAIETFSACATELGRRIAPEFCDRPAQESVRLLASRLGDERRKAQERERLKSELEELRRSIIENTKRYDQAESELAVLRALAGAADDAELEAAIARAAEHARLTEQIAEREAELHKLGDGRSIAELQAEQAGLDPDALPGRIAEIDDRLREISDENAAYAEKLAELRTELKAMEAGHDAAASAQAMRDALAEIEDIAQRYVRLRLAHTLLRASIDRFREQQQGPLLQRAGHFFARLSEGHYDRIIVDENENGQMVMVAHRPDGSHCPAERLSVGARDQLYLALRLAAIESYASRTEPLPFIADDLLVNFDDRRARAALDVLAEFGSITQTILLTHHEHVAAMAEPLLASRHELPRQPLLARTRSTMTAKRRLQGLFGQ